MKLCFSYSIDVLQKNICVLCSILCIWCSWISYHPQRQIPGFGSTVIRSSGPWWSLYSMLITMLFVISSQITDNIIPADYMWLACLCTVIFFMTTQNANVILCSILCLVYEKFMLGNVNDIVQLSWFSWIDECSKWQSFIDLQGLLHQISHEVFEGMDWKMVDQNFQTVNIFPCCWVL